MEKYNEKAEKYNKLIRDIDVLDHQISQLKTRNGGINISEQTEKEIYHIQLRKQKIQKEIQEMLKD